uniref:Resolvase n=1 Tax=Eubacterium cellulosolvens (strain ATCC 43171 / JCM 9499 / 6) TaxID=633697 RepID=I5AWF7_EUBC6
MKINSLEEALKRIDELEKEVAELKSENEKLRGRNFGGRKKHDEAWMSAYNDFVMKYENGKNVMEIVVEGKVSRRTAYRYLAYYRELQKLAEEKGDNDVADTF